MKENILFGETLDEDKLQNTIELCQLQSDIEVLPGGINTEIGEKGINLSGGQKARVSLARAVYANRDVILMDDPLSALDAKVKRRVFDNLILGHLKDKTRILVTHAVEFLEYADRIVIMEGGKVSHAGTFNELADVPYIQQIAETLNNIQLKRS